MFRSILQASPHPDKSGFVIDLRSPSDAAGQKSKGGGTEMIDHYFHWRHVHARMGDTGTFQEQILKMVDAFGGTDCPSFFTKMEGAQWLNDVRNLMSTAVVIVRATSFFFLRGRTILPRWGSIRSRLAPRHTYDAPPCGPSVRVVGLTKPKKLPARKTLPW